NRLRGDHDALVSSSHLPRRSQRGAAPTIFGLMTARGSTSFARIAAGRREAAGLGRSEPVSQGPTVSPAVWRKDHRQSHHHRINYDFTNGDSSGGSNEKAVSRKRSAGRVGLGGAAVADFAPVTLIGLYPLMMVVPNSSPAHSVEEFIAYAKVNKL